MVKQLLLSLFTLLMATMAWADVEINETNFPDENFRNWVLKQWYASGRVLTDAEIAEVTIVDVIYEGVQTLQGIEFFTALRKLHCYNNQLTVIDVSKNTALTTFACFQNQINGAAMDALVESLPTVNSGMLYVIYNEDEQNEMTEAQAVTAKAKGWMPKFTLDGKNWLDYDGPDRIRSIDNGQLIIDNEAVYNIAGQRLQKMRKGINIVGGKKILVK